MDNRGQGRLGGETMGVLLIRSEVGGQAQSTPGEHRDQTVVAQRTDETIERHGGKMADHRADFQTEATMGGQERSTGDLRSHRAVPQDEVGEDREHGATRGALEAPNRQPPRRTRA
ncbi:MAG: hypothetical protein AB7N91_32850 [Candidatus Tectimicrobiota bacterium]